MAGRHTLTRRGCSALRKPPVNDIRVWLECFARMAVVLVTQFPEKGPELWAYQTTILKAAHTYEGSNWVSYDRKYRRDMLACKGLNWSVPNMRLYNEAFTGRARMLPRCPHCLSEDHMGRAYPYNPNSPVLGWFQDPRQLLPPTAQLAQPQRGLGARTGRREVCLNFNNDWCYMARCRFLHVCTECNGSHPLTRCPLSSTACSIPRSGRGRGAGRGCHGLSHPYHPEAN